MRDKLRDSMFYQGQIKNFKYFSVQDALDDVDRTDPLVSSPEWTGHVAEGDTAFSPLQQRVTHGQGAAAAVSGLAVKRGLLIHRRNVGQTSLSAKGRFSGLSGPASATLACPGTFIPKSTCISPGTRRIAPR